MRGEADSGARAPEGPSRAAGSVDEARAAVEEARGSAGLPAPRLALVLGSGLGGLADRVEDPAVLPYEEIPGWPRSTVSGHAGRLVLGRLAGVPAVLMQGRIHMYEGPEPRRLAFPPRVFAGLGVRALLVSNAAGAVNREFSAGDLMLITDHLNLLWSSPLEGSSPAGVGSRSAGAGPSPDDGGPSPAGEGAAGPEPVPAYDPALSDAIRRAAGEEGTTLREGVYAAMLGPSYETPAEIRMLERLGADAVGMSTVPEVLAARAGGIRCAGVSCLTNLAAGVGKDALSHEEVLATTERVAATFQGLVVGAVRRFESEGLLA